jgi:hypothetical protein
MDTHSLSIATVIRLIAGCLLAYGKKTHWALDFRLLLLDFEDLTPDLASSNA